MTSFFLYCRFGVDTRIALVGSVSCSTSRYTVLLQCSMTVGAGISSLCTDNDDISVTCCKLIIHVTFKMLSFRC